MQVLVSAFYLVYFLLSWCLVFCTMLLLFDDENPLIELTDDGDDDATNLVWERIVPATDNRKPYFVNHSKNVVLSLSCFVFVHVSQGMLCFKFTVLFICVFFPATTLRVDLCWLG